MEDDLLELPIIIMYIKTSKQKKIWLMEFWFLIDIVGGVMLCETLEICVKKIIL